jgi:hypothetical protein
VLHSGNQNPVQVTLQTHAFTGTVRQNATLGGGMLDAERLVQR